MFSQIGDVINGIKQFVADIPMYITVYGLSACMFVGTVSLLLKILGFNTLKWVYLSATTFLILIVYL